MPVVDPRSGPSGAEAAGEPGPDLRLLSVLFCDMVDSTSLSAQFNAEEMHDLISAYHETVAERGHAVRGLCGKVSWRRRARLFRLADGL